MKIAVSGKGGAGKSTVAAALALLLAESGGNVLALDADPDANLAAALGMPKNMRDAIVPITGRVSLIEERTGASVDNYGKVFKLNPDVSDVAERFGTRHNGVNIVVLGAVRAGGGGCACPEGAFLKALVTDLILYKDDALVMDMEAGVEHLGRATAAGVNAMVVVAEPGMRSIECAVRVKHMAEQIGIKKIFFTGNKIKNENEKFFIEKNLGETLAAAIPYSEKLREADMNNLSVLDGADRAVREAFCDLAKIFKDM